MTAHAAPMPTTARHPVDILVMPKVDGRNRLSTAFRPLLALPHLVLVGGPMALTVTTSHDSSPDWSWGVAGVLGAVAGVCAIIAWFAIIATGRYPTGLRALVTYYLHWRVRVVAYAALLRDEYPPFGDGPYPVSLAIGDEAASRDRLSVAFRPILVIPHVLAVWVLGVLWLVATLLAWVAIIATGRFPSSLYHFGVGAMRWSTRAEAYLLLLHDEFPPFSLA